MKTRFSIASFCFVSTSLILSLNNIPKLSIVSAAPVVNRSAQVKVPANARITSSTENSIPLATNYQQVNLPFLLTSAAQPYIGKWSNGRGETLLITSTRIQFANNKQLIYQDVTKVTDGNFFQIQITNRGKINFFQKFLSLRIEGTQMIMTGYNSYKDMYSGQNQGLEVTWYR